MCQILLCSYSLRGHTPLARQPTSVKSRAPILLRKLVFTCLEFLFVARFEPHLWWAFDSSPIGDSTGRVGDKNDATRTQCSRIWVKIGAKIVASVVGKGIHSGSSAILHLRTCVIWHHRAGVRAFFVAIYGKGIHSGISAILSPAGIEIAQQLFAAPARTVAAALSCGHWAAIGLSWLTQWHSHRSPARCLRQILLCSYLLHSIHGSICAFSWLQA